MARERRVKVADLKPGLRRLSVLVCVLEIGNTRTIRGRNGREHVLREALVGDETGCVVCTLWDRHVDALEVGKTYLLHGVSTTLFRQQLRLVVGRGSRVEIAETEIDPSSVNTQLNMSKRRWSKRK